MHKAKRKAWEMSILSSAGIGLGFSLAVTILGVCIGAILISNEYLKPQGIIYLSIIIQFISSLVGALFAGKISAEKKVIASGLAAISYFCVLVGVAILVFDGIKGGFIAGIVACLVGSGAAIMLCNRAKIRPKRKRRRMVTR